MLVGPMWLVISLPLQGCAATTAEVLEPVFEDTLVRLDRIPKASATTWCDTDEPVKWAGSSSRYVPAQCDLGYATAVLPTSVSESGTAHPPRVAFGLPSDGRGSVWFLSPGAPRARRLGPPSSSDSIRDFGAALVAVPDLTGDGAADLLVAARSGPEDEEETRWLVVSGSDREIVRELAPRTPHLDPPITAVPDRDGDGTDELLLLQRLEVLEDEPERTIVTLDLISGATGKELRT